MDQEELARRAGVSVVTVPGGLGSVSLGTVREFQRVLGTAGAEFIERGVRRRQRTPEEIEARVQAILEIAKRSAELLRDAPPFTEDDLYDEDGLPA